MKHLNILGNRVEVKPLEAGKLGFFSQVYIGLSGEYKGKVIKQYRSRYSNKKLAKVKELHDRYITVLKKAGVQMPTTLMLVDKPRLYIIQDAFEPQDLLRQQMQQADYDDLEQMMLDVLQLALSFTHFHDKGQYKYLGFHPTLRNYARAGGQYYYFDSFPPMIGIHPLKLRKLMLDFAPIRYIPFRGFLTRYMSRVTDEYYDRVKMLKGIVGSSCRLRPEHADKLLATAKGFVSKAEMSAHDKEELLEIFSEPPKLSTAWTIVRRLLGMEGRPNVK